jgi:hypothetical protein
MPTFRAPQYTKVTNSRNGVVEPCYTFNIDYTPTDEYISFVASSVSDISLESLKNCITDNLKWWATLINQFLVSSSKLFSKPYTVENINKIAKHSILQSNTITTDFPAQVTYIPKSIQISGGNFMVIWGYEIQKMVIDIPDLGETSESNDSISLPAQSILKTDDVEELDINNLQIAGNSTDDELFEINSPAKIYDRQRVKEARLKAKLAVYKAQRQISKYYEKYGDDDISDSDTETDYETSDNESESENEDVQL